MGIDIASGIHEEIIVSECEEYRGSHVDRVSFGDTSEVKGLVFSDGHHICPDEYLGEVRIARSGSLLETTLVERMAVSEARHLDERIEESACFLVFLSAELHESDESGRYLADLVAIEETQCGVATESGELLFDRPEVVENMLDPTESIRIVRDDHDLYESTEKGFGMGILHDGKMMGRGAVYRYSEKTKPEISL